MHKIHHKTLQDLEFSTVLSQIESICNTELGKEMALQIFPYTRKEELFTSLRQTSEYVASFDNNNSIPGHYFDSISPEIKLLHIENTLIELGGFKKIASISATVNTHILFFRKFREYYPTLHQTADKVEHTTAIIQEINSIIDRFGEIKDDASEALSAIRKSIGEVRGKINQSFLSALQSSNTAGYLDDIRETVVENRRVLAVKAMYRKRVKGAIMGNSKTGSIVYIEPETTLRYSRELGNLEYEESEEIKRILRALTDFLRPYIPLLEDYQDFLATMDVVAAKAKYAQEMNAILPSVKEEKKMHLIEAYHPLLYLTNKKKEEKTYPQSISLDMGNRVIVISGPNAGGKSITLKTVGLLQLMLQSGMLVPVHPRSEMCLFDRILTDIGDNQSIENHLSTYSYRLKNMNFFLRKCNAQTLFLIDEFGTGSDPELGGALAETFLEEFYHREAFGIITTHYANLKMLANELPCASNANMLFDSKSLEPVFRLIVGEAGSSFTFEVAQKNGIPYSLINRAKKKIERGKVRFDATIAKLQKERNKMEKTSKQLKDEETKARDEAVRLEGLNEKIQSKLESYQQLFDHNQRMIYLGNKVNDIAEKYFADKKKRPLISEFLRIVETENSKRKPKPPKQKKEEKIQKKQVAQEMEKKVEVIREKKKKEKKKAALQEKNKPQPVLKIGDRVRMTDGKAVGDIETIEKNKAVVNYGLFTTNVSLDQLELVEAKKK
ncbi:endonuclease MutS2 [Sinomicrobium weinanense]|uniref:DNA mismatch repair protein MutS n=1 Tax=Sinomicrobium weinanense TaxID=2842200 RepID=A0A926Q2W0_9FLAO|nr:DNA mismatch repair protein MutS [Sinomicrobium weinanense]MBC9796239.1 DNA mismatch repair protein MutS [Sinomicrobium weinanense]MBU3122306.1 DNA mismatch repair protein MutS [Sinomicrobium weinanense]